MVALSEMKGGEAMWFIVSWADSLGYDDVSFELMHDGTPRSWKRERSAKSWAAKNCAFHYQLIFIG